MKRVHVWTGQAFLPTEMDRQDKATLAGGHPPSNCQLLTHRSLARKIWASQKYGVDHRRIRAEENRFSGGQRG